MKILKFCKNIWKFKNELCKENIIISNNFQKIVSVENHDIRKLEDIKDFSHYVKNFNNFYEHKSYVNKYLLKKLKIKSLDNISDNDKVRLTKEITISIISEISELINELPWKYWKNNKDFKIDYEKVKFELVDLQHFLNNLYFIWQMNFDEVMSYFKEKLKTNISRQENGY